MIEVLGKGNPKSNISFSPTAKQIDTVRKDLDESKTNHLIKNLILWKPSVSKLPIYVGFVFVLIWLLLLSATIAGPFEIPAFIVGFQK